MALCERDLVTRLLKQSILTLCRETVTYKSRLEVDGIICLTADDQEQHVVKIHEFFDKPKESENICRPVRNSLLETAYPARHASGDHVPDRNIVRCATNEHAVEDTSNNMETVLIKTEPNTDTGGNSEAIQEDKAIQSNSPQEMKSDMQNCADNLTNINYSGLGLNKLSISSARNILCKKCNSTLENVELFQVHNMNSHNHFTCLVCLTTFTSRNNMKRHIRLHTGIKPYSCHKCPERFSRNDDFKRHLLKHASQKPFRCAVCKIGYQDRSCVKSHMMKEHNAKIFHVCAQCGESYIDLMKFQQHKKCHPELQDYRCSICSFTGSSALMYNKHMLTHGPLKEYTCTHCDLSYSDPFMYTSHLKKHKGDELVNSYTCCFCDNTLPSFEQFQRHEHTHVHSKQHVCELCNKVFRYPSNLREHMLTHLPKSTFQGVQNARGISEFSDNSHIAGDPFPITLQDNHSSNGDYHMQTDEENNNKIDENIELDIENEDNPADKDDMNGCSDYWCTECSHGFGTENELQNHIIYKHEKRNDEINGANEGVDNRTDFQSTTNIPDPFEVSTQIDSTNGIVYNENTQRILSKEHSLHDENTNNNSLVRERQSSEHPKRVPSEPSIFRSKQTRCIYDEDTIVDRSDSRKDMLNNIANASAVKHTPDSNKKIVLNTVTDAMRQVKSIQSRFGIKSTELDTSRMRDSKELRKKVADDALNTERRKSWPHPLGSFASMSEYTEKQHDRPMSISVSGMKMKIQRASYVPSNSPNDTDPQPCTISKDFRNSERGLPSITCELGGHKDTATSEQCSSYNRSSVFGMNTEFSSSPNRSSATTLNLKVRNPGFERVVTPDVLFKTKAPFTCEICEETFESFDAFHDHGVKVHRRFICSYCGKVFTSRPNRERHIRYHTGEKPYKCELCSSTFLRGDDLKYHRTTKHADIKPFTCGACQTSFSLPKDLEKHLKIYPDHRL